MANKRPLVVGSDGLGQQAQPGDVVDPDAGGTGTRYFQVSGPVSLRTFTFPDANDTVACLGQNETVSGNWTFSAILLLTSGLDLRPAVPNQYTITFSGTTITMTSQGAIAFAIGTNNAVVITTSSVSLRSGSTVIATASSTGFAVAGVVTATSSITSNSSVGGIGYTTGAGGTATQATSKSTAVTLNKICGQITMNAAALASNSSVAFTFNNTNIAATDVVRVTIASGASSMSYFVQVEATAAGSCVIALRNYSGGSLSEAVVLNFAVMKAVSS